VIDEEERDLFRAIDGFIEELLLHADHWHGKAPLWYGWAVRDAFRAGVAWQQTRKQEGEIAQALAPSNDGLGMAGPWEGKSDDRAE
jgi:hypothetical protein